MMKMNFMVSFQSGSQSANSTFPTLGMARKFIEENSHLWESHSIFVFGSGLAVAELTELT